MAMTPTETQDQRCSYDSATNKSATSYQTDLNTESLPPPTPLATIYRTLSGSAAPNFASQVVKQQEDGYGDIVRKKLGTFPVYMTSCETMWGVIIFIKFDEILGEAGLWQTLGAVLLSMCCQLLAASSLSAIATNGKFTTGGAYNMVVRSLGPAIGAAIGILYFLGMSLLAVVEILGATEALHVVFEMSSGGDEVVSVYWDQVIFGIILLVALTLVGCKDSHYVHQLGVLVMVVVLLAVISCLIGIFATEAGWASDVWTPSPELNTTFFQENLHPHYSHDMAFGKSILTLIYPTFIGIFQGANKVSELKNSYRSIPRGAFFSIFTSGVFYVVLFCLLALVSPPDALRDSKTHILLFTAWPSQWFSVIATIIIGLGSALSCIDVAPRILQSLASDGIIPLLGPFAQLDGKSQEPRRATMVTLMLCIPAMFMREIETVATYTSLAFLCMYASMNASCFVLSVLNLHSWRPKFKYYHWSAASAGFILCIAIMFLMAPIPAGIMMFVFLMLIIYVQLRGERVTFGHGLQGLKYKLALSSLLALEKEDLLKLKSESIHEDEVKIDMKSNDESSTGNDEDWRPQLLCYVKLNDSGQAVQPSILDFVQQLKGSKGLNMVATILDEDSSCSSRRTHDFNDMAVKVRRARKAINTLMVKKEINGFAEIISAPIESGEITMIQTLGLGKLRPNTLVVGWPKRREEPVEAHKRSARFLRFLGCATAFEKALVALKPGRENFPLSTQVLRGTIDIWWVVHDGGLLLLLAHLLQAHQTWSGCRLRIFTAVDISESPILIQRALAQYLHDVRIQAEVHVVDISKKDVAEYCKDWTLRAQRYGQCTSEMAQSARSILMKRASVAVIDTTEDDESKRTALTDVFTDLPAERTRAQSRTIVEQARAACRLKSSILEHSSMADLVVLNLPVPSTENWENPTTYVDMIDDMTEGLRRILLVHGSGTEALSKYA